MSVIYKQILEAHEATALNDSLIEKAQLQHRQSNLITGKRVYYDLDLTDSMLSERLFTVLRDYFPAMRLDRWARFYSHEYGAVKPHRDGNHDFASTHTILIYLSDQFDGGRLSIKTRRSDEERLASEQPNHFHKVYTISEPRAGYGVIFSKNDLHWAEECTGDKNFLLIHLCEG